MPKRSELLAKNSLFLYLRTFFRLIIALYTSRVILATLGINDYGIYNVIGGVVTMFAFLNSALSASSQRFFTFEMGRNDQNNVNVVFNISKKIHTILSIFIFVITEIAGIWYLYNKMNIPVDRINAGFWVLQSSTAILVLNIISVPYNAAIVAHEKFSVYAYVGITEAIFKLFLAISLSLWGIDQLKAYAVGMFLIAAFIFIYYRTYCHKKFYECTHFKNNFNKVIFKKMFSFASWNFLGGISQYARNQGVNIVFNILCGLTVNAAQGVATQVNGAITQFISGFTAALDPQITKAYSSNDKNYFNKLIFTGAKISLILMSLIAIPAIFEVDYLLHLWLKKVPSYTIEFVRLTFVSMLISSLVEPVRMSIKATGNIKLYSILLSVLNILILPVSYWFLNAGYEPYVVYKLYVIVQLFNVFILLFLTFKIFNFNYILFIVKVIMPIFIIISGVSFILFKLQTLIDESFGRLCSVFSLSSILILLLSYFIVFSRDEKEMIKDMFNNVKYKIRNKR